MTEGVLRALQRSVEPQRLGGVGVAEAVRGNPGGEAGVGAGVGAELGLGQPRAPAGPRLEVAGGRGWRVRWVPTSQPAAGWRNGSSALEPGSCPSGSAPIDGAARPRGTSIGVSITLGTLAAARS
jgi:hypothetical protein